MIILPFVVGVITAQVIKRDNPQLAFVLFTPARQFAFSIFVGLAVAGAFATAKKIF